MMRQLVDKALSFVFQNEASMDLSTLSADPSSEHATTLPSRISLMSRVNLLHHLLNLVRENSAYYANIAAVNPSEEPKYRDLLKTFALLCSHIVEVTSSTQILNDNASLYDAVPGIEGNGYRSLLAVVDACVVKLMEPNLYMKENKEYFYFRWEKCHEEIKDYVEVLGMLRAMLKYAEKMIEVQDEDEEKKLFPKQGSELLEQWLVDVETLNQTCFYGSCMAFHFCPSVRAALLTITTAFTAFAEKFRQLEDENPGTGQEALGYLTSNFFASRKFVMDPKLKAQVLVTSTRDFDIRFCKAFWSVAESRFWAPVHWWLLPRIMINREFFILPETFTLPGLDGKGVTIKAPVCHVGERPLMARLMSSDLRQGQMLISDDDPGKTFKLPDKVLEKSPVLIFHAHGGGFVAQSSKACDIYLTEWAKELQLPLLSIDYTLAPEGPYPRAVEEVFYAYCWALRYPHKLGWTGEKILLVGDSAGGNLIFGVAFQAFMEGIRMPNGLVAIYPPFLAQYTPSPSRLLALMDPLIPMGILTRCLAAYAGLPETTDVGMVQGVDNDSPDSSPSNESVGSWDQMSPSELKGAEDMFSINSPSDDDASIRAKERLKEEQAQAAIRANQRGFSFHVPVANHLYSLALPVTSRVSGGVSRVKDVVTSGIRGARSLIASPSPETAGNPRRRSKSVINPTAPWTKMMNPLKRYNFAMVPVNDPLLSPLQADDVLMRSLPPVSIIAAHLDPFLDDSIAFAKKLRAANKLTSLDILPHLPHGFLNFVLVGEKPRQGNRLVMRRINEMLTDGLGLHL